MTDLGLRGNRVSGKVKKDAKYAFVKATLCYFFGIRSEKVIIFSERIPKKLYLCRVKTMDYD